MKHEKSHKADAVREQIKAEYQAFLETEGKLPRGFTEPYITIKQLRYGTPFRKYLDTIQERVDRLQDESGISDWLYFDGSLDIQTAAEEIIRWRNLHKEMERRLSAQCRDFFILRPVKFYAAGQVMVVVADVTPFRHLGEDIRQACREANVSFCTILTENSLYDLIEQKEKQIDYDTHPGYHDETYAEWWLK